MPGRSWLRNSREIHQWQPSSQIFLSCSCWQPWPRFWALWSALRMSSANSPATPVHFSCAYMLSKKKCPSRTYMCWIGLIRHTTRGKWWLCLNASYYTLTQDDYVRQIFKQLKSITWGCEKVNVMNIHMSVVSHCVVTYTNQVSWPKSGLVGAFSFGKMRKKIARSVSRENLKTWH